MRPFLTVYTADDTHPDRLIGGAPQVAAEHELRVHAVREDSAGGTKKTPRRGAAFFDLRDRLTWKPTA
jgi:hypothetical protein